MPIGRRSLSFCCLLSDLLRCEPAAPRCPTPRTSTNCTWICPVFDRVRADEPPPPHRRRRYGRPAEVGHRHDNRLWPTSGHRRSLPSRPATRKSIRTETETRSEAEAHLREADSTTPLSLLT